MIIKKKKPSPYIRQVCKKQLGMSGEEVGRYKRKWSSGIFCIQETYMHDYLRDYTKLSNVKIEQQNSVF